MLALVGTALVTALAGAQMATQPDDGEMARTITRQQVSSGKVPSVAVDHGGRAMTPDEMLTEAATLGAEYKRTLEHAETSRVSAHRTRDIIRMTCVDDKLGQMKEVFAIAKPRFSTIKELRSDEFHMLSQLTVIRQGVERMRQLSAEMEACSGDSLEAIGAFDINEQGAPGTSVADPTLPAYPTVEVYRPEQASPYY